MIYRQVGWVGMFVQQHKDPQKVGQMYVCIIMYICNICLVIVALCAGMTLGYWMLFGWPPAMPAIYEVMPANLVQIDQSLRVLVPEFRG